MGLSTALAIGAAAQEAAATPAAAPAAACTAEQDASPELRAQREEVVYLWSQAAVSASQFSNNTTLQQDFLSTILTQNATLDVKGAGAYTGLAEVAEYTLLVAPSVNDQLIQVANRTVLSIDWTAPNVANTTYLDRILIKGQPPVEGNTVDEVQFVPCSTMISQVTSYFASGAMGNVLKAASDTGSPEDICNLALFSCPGELFPYPSMLDCISFISALPATCNDGVHTLQGNTTACRQLHVTAARLLPLVHCQHVGPDSMKCVQDECSAYSAPGVQPRVQAGYPYTPDGAAWAVAAVLLALCLLGVAAALLLAASAAPLQRTLYARAHSLASAAKLCTTADKLRRMGSMMRRSRRSSMKLGHPELGVIFSNLCLKVPGKTLLSGCWGHIKAGEMVAIMGPSGSGKSTLLKLLLGRTELGSQGGSFSGRLGWYRGQGDKRQECSGEEVKEHVAFLEQDDSLLAGAFPELTVFESLLYQASLVLPHRSPQQLAGRVDEVLHDTLMESAGTTTIRSLSGGQRRRWALALQLLRDPSGILLDEPTSGLDASMALTTVRVLRRLANNGCLVALTIHQPRSAIFKLFDQVMVMSGTGSTAYFGPTQRVVGLLHRPQQMQQQAVELTAGVLEPVAARQLALAFLAADVSGDGVLDFEDCKAFLATLPLAAVQDVDMAALQESTFAEPLTFAEVVSRISNLAQKLGLTPVPTIDMCLEMCFSDEGRAVLSPGQTAGMQVIALALLQRNEEALAEADAGADQMYTSTPADLLVDFFARRDANVHLCSDRQLLQLNAQGQAEVAAELAQLPAAEPAGQRPLEKAKQLALSLPGRLSVRLLRFAHATPLSALLGYGLGALAIAVLALLLFPQLKTDGLGSDYLFPACMLIVLAALTNTGFFNKTALFIQPEKPLLRHEFMDGSCSTLEAFYFVWMRDSLLDAAAALLLFFPLYWGVGYARGSSLGGFESFTALLLFLGVVSSAGNLLHLLLQSSLATLCCGLWMAWNSLFAGVLIKVPDLFVIWRPWAAYISPYYHVINVWILNTFYRKPTDCGAKDATFSCPPTGGFVLSYIGYGNLTATGSLGVLGGYYVLQWTLVLLAIWRRFRRVRPARYESVGEAQAASSQDSADSQLLGKGVAV
ncbi:ATP-binding cassette [Chlorella sorokiniana]|uniref:ATP-binding cassette n=1 Tax=Chlorella sorokiniana TaxID=3076 RepID=A0A2P6TT58_CHLSO|nr:ATP-binding cassette [Chlorella sorokiniana]|eukprot:PRW57234.1 ATP-binding cassette [Chlorella sorokiniana]